MLALVGAACLPQSDAPAPIARLDRAQVLKAASRLEPRGETPLIHAILQGVGDPKTGFALTHWASDAKSR
jgi:hypothetical protein